MNQEHHQIAIIGAGTGGVTVAAQLLLKDKGLDVAIIDPADTHYYQAAWTLVGAGTYNMEKTARPMRSVIPKGAKWIQKGVTNIDADGKKLTLNDGSSLTYDYLIASPGVQYDLDGIEGLAATIGKNNVCSNYIDANYTWEVLQSFKGGTAIFTQPATPIKCGGAPQKIMYLADDYFRKHGVRNNSKVTFVTPGSVIFGVEPFKQTLMQVVDRKNIDLRFFHKIVKIDGPNKKAYFEFTNEEEAKRHYNKQDLGAEMVDDKTVAIPFEMLHLAPPQSAPDFIKESKLAHADGPSKGWINVNHFTLQHNEYSHVFALGDAAALPTAKTGAAVRKQAPVVVENLLHVMKEEAKLSEGYHGYSSCPLVTGYGKMVLAEFGYGNERMSDPTISKFVDTAKENWSMWLLKKYGLPYMYWNLMLKGKA
jgi:sulfide:quinone oxidoreductase